MINRKGKRTLSKTQRVEELDLGASLPEQTKTRLNVTVLPKTSSWLKKQGNASHTIDELVEVAKAGNFKSTENPSEKIAELIHENEELRVKVSELQNQKQKAAEQHRDYQVIRDQALASLKLGRQAPGYKSAVKALDRFIAEIR